MSLARLRIVLAWAGLAAALAVPFAVAASSPLLAWRDPVYIAAGLTGVVALGLLLVQPLLALGVMPGLSVARGRRIHPWVGVGLVAAVVAHVGLLWVTSPPDVVDALLFRSATPFSDWGVVAMWAVFGAALLAAFRSRLGLRLMTWRLAHTTLAAVVVVGTVVHAMLVDGAMGPLSKAGLCALVLLAAARFLLRPATWQELRRIALP